MLSRLPFAIALLLPALAVAQQPTTTDPAAAAPAEAAVAAPAPRVALHTNMGDIVIELYPDKAPQSVQNFLQYVDSGHYNGTIFHRVINDFMIQGGGYTADLQLKPTRDPIQNEANNGLSNLTGTVSMARTNEAHSAQAQFFINVVDNPRLDFVSEQSGLTWGYAVFGKVVEGMDAVERVRAVETGPQGPLPSNVPKTAVIIERAERLAPAPAAAPAPAPAPATPPAG